MRRDSRTARLIAALAAATVAAALQVGVPAWVGSLRPSLADVAVGSAFAAAAVLVTQRGRMLPAILLLASAVSWLAAGFASILIDPVGDWAARLSLLPHALIIAAVITLPDGRLNGFRERLIASLALGVGVFTGTGLLRPALLALGFVAISAAIHRWQGSITVVQTGLGLVFVGVDVGTISGLLPSTMAVNVLALAIVTAVVAVVLLLDRERGMWLAVDAQAGSTAEADPFGARLGRALNGRPVLVGFALNGDTTVFVDFAGRPVRAITSGSKITVADGNLIASVTPEIHVDPFIHGALVSLLSQMRDVAALRYAQRETAIKLAESRHLLLRAADNERQDLERQLAQRVASPVAEVAAALQALPNRKELLERATLTGTELERFGGTSEFGSTTKLGEILHVLATSGGSPIETSLDALRDLPPIVLRAAWLTCTEGVVNAVKYAPGSRVRIRAERGQRMLRLTIADDGPGGADSTGNGLRGLSDRAADLGGIFAVTTSESGTVLSLDIPISSPIDRGSSASPLSDFHDVAALARP